MGCSNTTIKTPHEFFDKSVMVSVVKESIEWKLVDQVIGLPFTVRNIETEPLIDPSEVQIVINAELDEPEDVEWAAIPLLFTLAL